MLDQSTIPYKPSIICLHGGGTSAAIFDCQTARLQRILQSKFQFIFIDAPFVAPPGPGVLPVYEGCDPFLSWQSSDTNAEVMPQEVDKLLQNVFQACLRKGNPPVGILGFSQGARVATGLLLSTEEIFSSIKFGVLVNGTSPALQIKSDCQAGGIVRVPTVHVHGLYDQYVCHSRDLMKYFPNDLTVLLEFSTGHRMPSQPHDIQALADSINAVHAILDRTDKPEDHSYA